MIRTDRRGFLTRLGCGGAVAALVPGLELGGHVPGVAGLAMAGGVQDEAYWRMVRAQFPLRAGVVPMNAANLCPAPSPVIEATARAAADIDGDVSFQNRAKYDELREELRARLASYLGAGTDEIALVRNTSEANGIVVGGLALGPGDDVVLSELNHPTNHVAWAVGAKRHGYGLRVVTFPATPTDAGEILAAFEAALSPGTRVLTFTDVSNVTGVRMPTRELCALGRARGIHVHVDGAQTFGVLRRDVGELGCDTYSASSHKWFMGPKEAGVLYVRSERVPHVWPSLVGVGWGSDAEADAVGARRFETLGQRDDAVFAGLAAALDFHELIGPARVETRTLSLVTALRERLAAISGVTPVTSADPDLRAGVCIVGIEGANGRDVYEALYTRHGIAAAPTGGLRFSPHIYNTMDDVAAAADAVEEVLAGR